MNNKTPIILCAGKNGRALVFGWVDINPVPGEPVELYDAQMILQFPSGGTFGLAAEGPPEGSKLTKVVPKVTETVWQEYLEVTPVAAEKFGG